MTEPCRILEWDSRHFGMRIARVERPARTKSEMDAVIAWSVAENVDGLYYYCDIADRNAIQLACCAGFDMVDVRVDLEVAVANTPESANSTSIRRAVEQDLPVLQDIARRSHQHSRFYADGRFGRAACDRLYELWIERDFRTQFGSVWVAEVQLKAVGYISCLIEERNVGRISLFAVDPEYRGRGIGKDLMRRALQWFREESCEVVRVSTQGANLGALRFYVRAGFVPREMGLWFHKWFQREST